MQFQDAVTETVQGDQRSPLGKPLIKHDQATTGLRRAKMHALEQCGCDMT